MPLVVLPIVTTLLLKTIGLPRAKLLPNVLLNVPLKIVTVPLPRAPALATDTMPPARVVPPL